MIILLHIAVAFFIFTSTILAKNPYIVCFLTNANNSETKQVTPKPKGCGDCRMMKEVEKSCQTGDMQSTCSISTNTSIKKKCACPSSQPISIAILHEIKLPTHTKTIVRFKSDYFNTSKIFNNDSIELSLNNKVHRTIASTIMLL